MTTPRSSNVKFAAQAVGVLFLETVFFGTFTPFYMNHRRVLAPVMRAVLLGCALVYVVLLAFLLVILVRKRLKQANPQG